jgi:hypothetical protein
MSHFAIFYTDLWSIIHLFFFLLCSQFVSMGLHDF